MSEELPRPIVQAPKPKAIPQGILNDRLEKPVIFVSGEKSARVKIPGVKVGEAWLPTPTHVEFKDYKYACTSSYISGVLRRQCSPANIIELKD
jgi:hypothetical protein